MTDAKQHGLPLTIGMGVHPGYGGNSDAATTALARQLADLTGNNDKAKMSIKMTYPRPR